MIRLLQPAKGIEQVFFTVNIRAPFNVGEEVCCEDRCLFPVDELDMDDEFDVQGDIVIKKEEFKARPQKLPEPVS